MKKRLALVLVLVLMASAATTAFASPFADVPADHWAYDSVAELAAAGLIEGYPDGTYGGARMMTRYEAAMVFARALNRLESQIANNNLLPELDKIKAELMAEIEAQMAAAGKPVVETRVVETVLDEETPARVRANEIAIDALEGDMAYLEARMLGLIDGIRYDMNRIEEQGVAGVEQPSMDEIEALIAARVQESLLDVASGVKETTIVERVVSTTPELTRADVELIAEALIRKQVQELDRQVQENRDLIVGLVEWVDEIDTDVATLKDDVAGLKSTVAVLEKAPKLSGDLTMKAEYKKPSGATTNEYVFTQTGTLNLNIKASEATDVKAILGYNLTPGTLAGNKLTDYRVEVTSTTPVSKVVLGKMPKANLAPFANRYVLASKDYKFAGLAKVNIIDDLTLDLFAGQVAVNPVDPMQAAAALQYKFMPEIGVRLTGALQKPTGEMFENYVAGIGLFGTVVGVEYSADVVKDFNDAVENDYLGVVTAKTTFEPVTIDGKFIYQGDGYRVANQLVDAERKFGVEGGAKVELDLLGFGVEFEGRAYYEGGTHEATTAAATTTNDTDTVLAFKANASATYDEFFAPITLSAQYIANKTGDADATFRHHAMAKLAIAEDQKVGPRYGASVAYVKNILDDDAAKTWRNIDHIGTEDQVQIGANVGYGVNWSGAKVDLDYKADFVMTTQPAETKPSTLTHKVDVGYAFTDNVKLTLGGSVKQTFSTPAANAFGYNAGLTVKF